MDDRHGASDATPERASASEVACGTAEVRVFGALHAHRVERELPTTLAYRVPGCGTTARDIAEDLGLPRELIEGVFCNGHVYPLSHVVMPGDRVGFVPQGIPGPHRFMLGIYGAGREDGG